MDINISLAKGILDIINRAGGSEMNGFSVLDVK